MVETLYIRLGSKAQDIIHWLIFSATEQEIIASGEVKSAKHLNELTDKCQQRKVHIIVPSCDVLLKQLTVPGKSQRAVRQAVPYMLEDDLAQDVEQLFFAFADKVGSDTEYNCFTAIVEHEQMQRWLSWLSEAAIPVESMLPEVLAMPLSDNNWSAIALTASGHDQVVVRQGPWQGFTLDPIAWQLQCQALNQPEQSDSQGEQANPEKSDVVTIEAYSALAHDEQLVIAPMPEELPLALMAKHYQQSNFNLLQGEFKVKSKQSYVGSHWLTAASIAVFALLLSFGYKAAQLWQVNHQLAQVEQEIVSSYKQAFPKTKRVRVSTIKSQLNQKLALLGGASDSAGFLAMLAKIQPAFSQVPALKPSSLKFDGKRQELRLQATANDYQHFEQFKAALDATGLTIKQGAQNNQGSEVTGSFSIVNKQGAMKSAQQNKKTARRNKGSRGASS